MWIGFVSLFPEFLKSVLEIGVVSRAIRNGIIQPRFFNPRDYATDKHGTVDDSPYGGGPGMVLMAEPLLLSIAKAKERSKIESGCEPKLLYLSPQGTKMDQAVVKRLSKHRSLLLLAGRYEGIDERVIESEVDEEISIGDYVLSGGEIPAMVLTDAISRLIPGTLGNKNSILIESHLDGLLDYPQYTRPEVVSGRKVPRVLLSGNHSEISRWRRKQVLQTTWYKRPDLLATYDLEDSDLELLEEIFSLDEENKNAKKEND